MTLKNEESGNKIGAFFPRERKMLKKFDKLP